MAAPTQMNRFVLRPAGRCLASRSRPIRPPKRAASSSFSTSPAMLRNIVAPSRLARAGTPVPPQSLFGFGRILTSRGRGNWAAVLSSNGSRLKATGLRPGGGRPCACELLGLPIQGVDFLGAGVAKKERRVVGGQTQPDAEVAGLVDESGAGGHPRNFKIPVSRPQELML